MKSYWKESRKECEDIDTFEDENGFFCYKGYGDRLHIDSMWIKPDMRNKKIGQKYQEMVFEHAKDNGYKEVSCCIDINHKYANENLAIYLHNKWKLGWLSGYHITLVKDIK